MVNNSLQGGTDESRKTGRPTQSWIDNNEEWTVVSFNQLIGRAEESMRVKIHHSIAPTALKLWDI